MTDDLLDDIRRELNRPTYDDDEPDHVYIAEKLYEALRSVNARLDALERLLMPSTAVSGHSIGQRLKAELAKAAQLAKQTDDDNNGEDPA